VRRALPAQGQLLLPGVKNIIAIASGKGGVGKSTVSTNLAVSLALDGAAVGLLDADITGPNIPLMMGIDGAPTSTPGGKIQPLERYGVKVISIQFFVPDGQPIVWRGPLVGGAIQQFLRDVEWGELDYLVVDMPPGTSDAQLTLAQSVPVSGALLVTTPQDVALADVEKALAQMLADTRWGELDYLVVDMPPGTGDIQLTLTQKVPVSGAVIVTTPQEIALLDARKGLQMFRKVGVPVLGIVENMGLHRCPACGHESHVFDAGGGRALAERYGTTLLGELPLDGAIREQADSGRPTVVADPASPVTAAFHAIARRAAGALAVSAIQGAVKMPTIRIEEET
jgi:ATP-binding protein involved in chromosome partitioning